ncbi:MAG TPA: hypothetical protein VFD23_01875 [Clostridia bacterium]|nr:hypothetical protein [Clostridia bacterium]
MKKRLFMCVICASLAMLFLFSGCLPFAKEEDESTTALLNETTLTVGETLTATPTQEATTQEGPPQVITYYTLKNTQKIDEYFTAGFDVELPKIDSDKLGALKINNEIDKLKSNIEEHSNKAGNLATYREITECSYQATSKDKVIFIALKASHGLMESEYSIENIYYAYDYVADKEVTNTDIALMFNLNESQVLTMVNAALVKKDVTKVTGFDKIELFVNKAGKLIADAKVESMMGSDYSELIELT